MVTSPLSVDEATTALLSELVALPPESAPLAEALGRVLAEPVVAPFPLPRWTNAAMDGYALRHADLAGEGTVLRLAGEQFAGRDLDLRVGAGECVRITTGAPLPASADTVAMKENTRLERRGEEDVVAILVPPSPGQHVRRAGEDTRAGDALLAAGQPLTPSRIALAASQGLAEIEIAKRPTVATSSTRESATRWHR